VARFAGAVSRRGDLRGRDPREAQAEVVGEGMGGRRWSETAWTVREEVQEERRGEWRWRRYVV